MNFCPHGAMVMTGTMSVTNELIPQGLFTWLSQSSEHRNKASPKETKCFSRPHITPVMSHWLRAITWSVCASISKGVVSGMGNIWAIFHQSPTVQLSYTGLVGT